MDLLDALRTTAAIREFTDEPVPDAVLARVLDTARFAPSGGNAQSWRVVVVRDPQRRRALRDLYLDGWYDYLAMTAAGLRPWAPTNDRAAEEAALAAAAGFAEQAAASGGGFAEHLDEVPALLALWSDLRALAAVDRDLDRYPFAGGASVYPFAWSLLLAARAEGLGGVITTMCVAREAEVRQVLGAPDHLALAAVIALGRPVHQPRRLRRDPVASFATIDVRLDETGTQQTTYAAGPTGLLNGSDAIAVTDDHQLIVGGTTTNSNDPRWVLIGYDADGELLADFGCTDGDCGGGGAPLIGSIFGLDLDDQGRIVAAGNGIDEAQRSPDQIVARFFGP